VTVLAECFSLLSEPEDSFWGRVVPHQGVVQYWHQVHLGAWAINKAGLIIE
jgi:hypothetical protein